MNSGSQPPTPSPTPRRRHRGLLPSPFRLHPSKKASSLITALLVLVVLSTIVVAFMQSMSIERAIARSAANKLRAELAVEAGVNSFANLLAQTFTNDNFIVVANGTTTFAGRTDISGNSVVYLPLVSNRTNFSELGNTITNARALLPSVSPQPASSGQPLAIFRDVGFGGENATASWVSLPDGSARFAFWARDLSAMLNADTAGNLNAGGKHLRPTGTNLNEIPLFSLFATNSALDPGGTAAATIITNKPHFLTPDSLRQAIGGSGEAGRHLTFGGGEDAAPDRIPFGLGYSAEGQKKRNLNAFVSSGNVTGLADFITANLPNFGQRAGGFTGNYNYTRTIAANIIDYADTDELPTKGPDYFGTDSYPVLNEWFDLHNAAWPAAPASDGIYYVTVTIRSFVEFWNTSNRTLSGTVRFVPNWTGQRVNVNGILRDLDDAGTAYTSMNMTLPPNGFAVLQAGTKSYTFPWGPTPPPSNANMPMPAPNPPINFQLFWNDSLVDRAAAGVNRGNASTGISRTGGNVNHWRGSASPLNNRSIGQTGDPRMNKFLQAAWVNHTYSGSDGRTSWGGRNLLPGLPQFEIRPSYWPQPQHDSAAGTKSPNSSTLPTSLSYPANEPDKAVAFFSNNGTFRSATELRFVFDPAMWNGITNSSPASALNAGGGIQLAIGRPEFPHFSTNARAASRLLDIFTASDTRLTKGRINLNTASPEALRALILGLDHSSDTALLPTSLRGTNLTAPTRRASGDSARPGESFVQAVLAARPMEALSQLAQIRYDNLPFFGNPEQWTTPPTSWNHNAATHLFSRIADLVSFQSRNFEVFVIGQSLDEKGRVRATSRKKYLLFLKPNRDAGGEVLTTQAQILFSREL